MFTGIVETVGRITARGAGGTDVSFEIDAGGINLKAVALGDSIAVDGVCLTVVAIKGNVFRVDISAETLKHTTLGDMCGGDRVNLEQAVTPTTRLGGHFVSGHVDAVGNIVNVANEGRSVRLAIRVPMALSKYIATKGSVCVDGVSLTVNDITQDIFDVNIIPHTQSATTIGEIRCGDKVNIEVDIVARYLERLLCADEGRAVGAQMSREFLAQHGYHNG